MKYGSPAGKEETNWLIYTAISLIGGDYCTCARKLDNADCFGKVIPVIWRLLYILEAAKHEVLGAPIGKVRSTLEICP